MPRTSKPKNLQKKIYLQYSGKEIEENTLTEKFKAEWTKIHKLTDIKDLKVYYKTDDEKAYFVVNDTDTLIVDFF